MNHCARVAEHCNRCEGELPFAFTMAFQPIVDVAQAAVVAYEALVRGPQGESAYSILSRVDDTVLYRFDQACRIKALELASRLGMRQMLSINFLPNAVYEPTACIQATLATSRRIGWPAERINFEITETERVTDRGHLHDIIETYRSMGFSTALDDFGAGFANLDLLADLRPDTLKLDRQLIKNIDVDQRRQCMARSIVAMAAELGIGLVAEGIETAQEARWLAQHGVYKQQGYYFARPALEQLPEVSVELFAAIRD